MRVARSASDRNVTTSWLHISDKTLTWLLQPPDLQVGTENLTRLWTWPTNGSCTLSVKGADILLAIFCNCFPHLDDITLLLSEFSLSQLALIYGPVLFQTLTVLCESNEMVTKVMYYQHAENITDYVSSFILPLTLYTCWTRAVIGSLAEHHRSTRSEQVPTTTLWECVIRRKQSQFPAAPSILLWSTPPPDPWHQRQLTDLISAWTTDLHPPFTGGGHLPMQSLFHTQVVTKIDKS